MGRQDGMHAQHATMFTARPPRDVSLYFVIMSAHFDPCLLSRYLSGRLED